MMKSLIGDRKKRVNEMADEIVWLKEELKRLDRELKEELHGEIICVTDRYWFENKEVIQNRFIKSKFIARYGEEAYRECLGESTSNRFYMRTLDERG